MLRVLCWNLYHGMDFPPNPKLFTGASRWLRLTVDDGTYIQRNVNLRPQFCRILDEGSWDLAGLQECPTAWKAPLARCTGSEAMQVLTSRNTFHALRRLGQILSPDLIRSNEGGSNMMLARSPWRVVPGSEQKLLLNPRSQWEARWMVYVRLRHETGAEVSAANVHLTTHDPRVAEREAKLAAETADQWSDGGPLVLMGDFNLRPERTHVFGELAEGFGLSETTHDSAIDHILTRGLELVEPPRHWKPSARELVVRWRGGARRLRLSDHDPVEAAYRVPSPPMV